MYESPERHVRKKQNWLLHFFISSLCELCCSLYDMALLWSFKRNGYHKKKQKNSMFFLFVCLNCGNTFIRRENYVAQIVPQCFFPSPLIICYAAFIFSALLYIRGCQRYSWQKRSHLAPWTRSVKTAKKGSQIWRLFTAYLFILVEKHCVLQG